MISIFIMIGRVISHNINNKLFDSLCMIDRKKIMRTFDKYTKTNILLPIINPDIQIKSWEEDDILFIDGLLSPEWCKLTIENSKNLYSSMKDEYPIDLRDSDRFLTINNELSSFLWENIKDPMTNYFKTSLSPLDNPNTNRPNMPYGFGVLGDWIPCGVNECFRFIKYKAPSVGFYPHRDTLYVENFRKRSIYTLLIYLNDLEKDACGETIFIEPSIDTKHSTYDTVSEELKNGYNITSSIKPKTGLIAIMDHNRIHMGNKLNFGEKYIIRSDIIFECIKRPDNYGPELWIDNPSFIESVGLHKDAKMYEMSGDTQKAARCYEKGLAIRQNTYI